MAFVGMRCPVWAPITQETEGQPVVYGEGVVLGEAISAEVTLERADAKLYADDSLAESDNSITGGSVSLTVDDIDDEVLAQVMDLQAGADGEYNETGDASPYGGLGYVRVRKKKGQNSYTAMWLHKVQLGQSSDSASTKGESTEYQTPTLEGSIMGVVIDESLKTTYRSRKTFDTAAEAIAWIKTKAHITEPAAAATEG